MAARTDSKSGATGLGDNKAAMASNDSKTHANGRSGSTPAYAPPSYAPPPGKPPGHRVQPQAREHTHTNAVIEAAKLRATDEQQMQQMLQTLQYQFRIYNSDIEPEHETDYPCSCPIHQYQAHKRRRYPIQETWARAVMYPGEKHYDDNKWTPTLFSKNPYTWRTMSPYGYMNSTWGAAVPQPGAHARFVRSTISLNNELNGKAQANVDSREPRESIWGTSQPTLEESMSKTNLNDPDEKHSNIDEKHMGSKKRFSIADPASETATKSRPAKPSKFSSFKSAVGMKSTEVKAAEQSTTLRAAILAEEQGRWPDEDWRLLVSDYQQKVGMKAKIADLRARSPIQYLHLCRAGYFEPIPVAWATQASNPLKFTIDAAAGWRGLTPAWRGYEDTAEERLYWVLNHREGSVGMRMKPDFISEMNMAKDRMAKAVEPPPMYFSPDDTCHLQHTSEGYSKQVMPPPFRAFDRPEVPTDDTMILLDVSGSMDFDPQRPMYNEYLVTGFAHSTQPKNKDVAKAIIDRFTSAMANHDHSGAGYDLITFANSAKYIGNVNHRNLSSRWADVRFGGGTRVMTGWQQVKERHFQKHSESAHHHPIYGWQAGPETPILRLLLLLDGEATDMDEFELDLLGCSWAHVTIFLIGVDGCPHHHRHANELQRINDVNHHVSFVDAQGNTPERYVTHELLKRHLGYDMPMQEFEEMEAPPPYDG